MTRGFVLVPQIRADLGKLISTVGMTQREVAASSGVSQPWISNLLTGTRIIRDRGLVQKFAHALDTRVTQGETTGVLTKQQANTAHEAVRRLLTASGLSVREHQSQPGGAVPREALNYVPRAIGDAIPSIFQYVPFTITVSGPRQSGKTTFLYALGGAALDRGMQVVTFDPSFAQPPNADQLPIEAYLGYVLSVLSKAIVRQLQATIEPFSDDSYCGWFPGWLRDAINASPNRDDERLLVIDPLIDPDPAATLPPQVAAAMLGVLRVLHNERAQGGLPVSIALGITAGAPPMPRSVSISSLTPYPAINVGWFTREESDTLLQAVGGPELLTHAEAMFEWLGGQPFLTHVAATRLKRCLDASMEVVPEELCALMLAETHGPICRHLRQVRAVLGAQEGMRDAFQAYLGQEALQAGFELDWPVNVLLEAKLLAPRGGRYEIPSKLYARVLEPLLKG